MVNNLDFATESGYECCFDIQSDIQLSQYAVRYLTATIDDFIAWTFSLTLNSYIESDDDYCLNFPLGNGLSYCVRRLFLHGYLVWYSTITVFSRHWTATTEDCCRKIQPYIGLSHRVGDNYGGQFYLKFCQKPFFFIQKSDWIFLVQKCLYFTL